MPLAPITLIYGPNSAGKSTLVQSLALLKQTFEKSSLEGEGAGLVFRGDLVDLGSFMTSVSRHDPTKKIELGLEFTPPVGSNVESALPDEAIYAGLSFEAGQHGGSRQSLARLGMTGGRGEKRASAGDDFLTFKHDSNGDFEFADISNEKAIVALINAHAQSKRRASDDLAADNLVQLGRIVESTLAAGKDPVFFSDGFFPTVPRPGFLDDHHWDIELAVWFEAYLHSQVRALGTILQRLKYLGPLRAIPSRYQDMGDQSALDVGLAGEHTAQLLWRRSDLVNEVNLALRKLEVPYDLSVLEISPEHGAAETEIDELRIEPLVSTRLIHRVSGVSATPKDVGFGVSQMLPVVVQLLVNKGATLCIEQPEVHIHPRLQAKVGELIATSALEKQNQVIVETHSETLINRIRLLLADPDHPLRPEHVQVLYIDDVRGVAQPSSLRLDQLGEFLDPWPDGFFAESSADEASRRARLLEHRKGFEAHPSKRPPTSAHDDDEWD